MTIFKYEEIFQHFAEAIDKGILLSGQKLSSLRKTALMFDCSLSVVMQAYEELECRRYIKSIEKTGYFVLSRKSLNLPEPQNYEHSLQPDQSRPSDMINTIMDMSQKEDFLPFGATIPDLTIVDAKKLSAIISRTARNDLSCLNHYTETNGEFCLREEISRYMLNKGVYATPDEIIITNGCTEALYLAVKAISQVGDTIAIESPAYLGIVTLLKSLNRNVIEIPTSAEKGIDLLLLEQIIVKNPIKALIVSPVFQNPLGFTMSVEDKETLYNLSNEYDFSIIEDDIYGDCSFTGKTYSTLKSLDDKGRVLYCSSFSKTLAPGIRIGWIIPGKCFSVIREVKKLSGLGGLRLIEKSVAEYLRSGAYEYHLKFFRKKIAAQTYGIKNLIEKYFPEDTKISTPEGGYYLWIELDRNLNSYNLFKWAYHQKIGIVPGPVYSASGKFTNCIRLSCGSPVTDATEEGIRKLGDRVKELIST